jgi:hypothetical protein
VPRWVTFSANSTKGNRFPAEKEIKGSRLQHSAPKRQSIHEETGPEGDRKPTLGQGRCAGYGPRKC